MKPFGEVFKIKVPEFSAFEGTFVKTLTADKTENRIIAKLFSEKLLHPSELRAAERVISEKYRLSGASILSEYPKTLLGDEYFRLLDEMLRAEFPSATGFLCDALWNFDNGENILKLTVKSEINGFFTSCVSFLKRAFEENFSMHIDVEIETSSEGDTRAEERVEMLRRKIEEEAREAAAKPRTVTHADEKPVATPETGKFRRQKSLNE
jgi:hypothetical protein